MEIKPKLTFSGYRGIWGKDLDEKIAFEYTLAFARMIKNHGDPHTKKIIVGRDARKTGPEILRAVNKALEKENLVMEYVGIIPTPSVLLLVKKLFGRGGIIITASHNPSEYNGLKFVLGTGLFTTQKEVDEIEEIRKNLTAEEKKYRVLKKKDQKEIDNKKYRDIHILEILKNLKTHQIINKRFKVVLDPINSAGSLITQDFLKKLGCEVTTINGESNGEFGHEPEPIQKNLKDLGEAVIKHNADIGFAQDPDADRLVVVNEFGEILNEEYTIAMAIQSVLSKQKTDVVVNMSTSNMCEDITNNFGKKIYRTKIGEANVSEKMIKTDSLIGGEGSGGVIYAKIHHSRDSIAGIGLILELLAREDEKVSTLVSKLPKYIMKKDKIPYSISLEMLYWKLKNEFHDAHINTTDGVRFDWKDSSWVHIRPSNTEPIIRIIGEAKNEERIDYLFNKVRLTLGAK